MPGENRWIYVNVGEICENRQKLVKIAYGPPVSENVSQIMVGYYLRIHGVSIDAVDLKADTCSDVQ